MAKDDYFKIVYVILKELYGCRKANQPVDLEAISPKRFGVEAGYLLSILEELLENGYIKGFIVKHSKTGKYVMNLEEMEITMNGIEYLQENSKMKQIYKMAKEIKDFIPGM